MRTLALIAIFSVFGCKHRECLKSHTEVELQPNYALGQVMGGSMGMNPIVVAQIFATPVEVDVCDLYAAAE